MSEDNLPQAATAEFHLPSGHVVLLDHVDLELIMESGPWCARHGRNTVYARRVFRHADGRRVDQDLHAFLTGWSYVDHINRNGLDNRRANLRPATNALNQANRGLPRNNVSGYKGVYLHRRSRRWNAEIQLFGRKHRLGGFGSPEEAARAYDVAALEAWGDYAWLNFPAGDAS